MKDKISYLEFQGKKYPLVFNLNVMEVIQEEYESIEEWGNITENEGKEPKIKPLKFGMLAMINEGIDIENIDREVKEPFIDNKQVGRILTEVGINKVFESIKQLTIDSTKTGEEEKNM